MRNKPSMKFILSALMFLPVVICYSQNMSIDLSAKGEKLSILLDVNNSNKTFSFKKTNINSTDSFKAIVLNEEIDTSWQRSFTIHNAADSEIAVLKRTKDDSYSIPLNELISKLQTGHQYYLYTIALPKDIKKRMLVRVVRRMVCKIIIKN